MILLRGSAPSQPWVGNQIDWTGPQARNLVGFWPLNEGGGLVARNLIWKNSGSISSGMAWRPGGGLQFAKANSQYVSVPGFSIDTTNSFTVSAYINPTGAYTYAAILGPDNNNGGFQFQILGTGALSMVKNNVIAIGTTSAGVVATNTWTRVACSYYPSSGAFFIYVGGRVVVSGTNAQTLTAAPLFIGRQGIGLEYFDGSISDVRIYQPAILAAAILDAHMNPNAIYRHSQLVIPSGIAQPQIWRDGVRATGIRLNGVNAIDVRRNGASAFW